MPSTGRSSPTPGGWGGVILTLLALGCGVSGDPGDVTEAHTGSFTVGESLTPLLEVGEEPTPLPLTQVGASLYRWGRIFFLEPGARRLRALDPASGAVEDLGGGGQGPGEFLQPGRLGFRGDSLFVHDAGARRLTWFSPDGTFIGTTPLLPGPGLPEGYRGAAEPLVGGGFAMRPEGAAWLERLGDFPSIPVLRVDSSGRPLDTLVVMPAARGLSVRIPLSPGGGGVVSRQAFVDSPILHVSASGREAIVVERSPLQGEAGNAGTVTRISSLGDTLARFATGLPRHPLSSDAVDSILRARWVPAIESSLGLTREGYVALLRRHHFIPDSLPPVEFAFLALDGRVWVAGWGWGETREWRVFTGDGELLGRFELPRSIQLHGAHADTVWGVRTGALDETILLLATVPALRTIVPGPVPP